MCYSLLCNDGASQKKAKGVLRNVLKRIITHADYAGVCEDPDMEVVRKQRRIESNRHQLYTTETGKRVMGGGGDDKRYWLPHANDNTSFAYGHWRLNGDNNNDNNEDNDDESENSV